MRYCLCIVLSLFLITAQAQKQDTVRWFVGHWVNKKTFKIDSTIHGKGGTGGTITVTAGGGLSFDSPAEKKFEESISQGIDKIDEEEKKIADANKQAEGMYQFSLTDETIKELEKIKEDYKKLTKEEKKAKPLEKSANTIAFEKSCTAMSPEYHRIIDFYKAHKNEKNPHFDLPPPPEADYFNCWGCDSQKRIDFDTLSARYERDFFKDESTAINFLLGNLQTMDAVGIGAYRDDNVDEDIRQAFDSTRSHHGACSYIDYYDMSTAVEFYMRRGLQKLKQLRNDNLYNYGATKPILMISLATYQQQCALGNMTLDQLVSETSELARPIERLYDTLTTLLIEKEDYRLIATIPFMVGLYQSILGLDTRGTINGELQYNNYRPKHTVESVIGFPHFELSIELETKLGDNGKYVITHLKSLSKLNAELDDKECVKFILSKKENGKIVANGSVTTILQTVSTTQSTNTSTNPVFKIHFCSMPGIPDGDSIFLAIYNPRTTDMLFVNTEQMKTDVQNINPDDNKQQMEAIQKNALDMQEKLKQMQASGADPMKMAEMVKKMMNNVDGVVKTQAMEILRVRLPLKVNNMNSYLVNQRFDAKEINPGMPSKGIVYAYLTIKIKHTPINGFEED